jgi:hypothetical protein
MQKASQWATTEGERVPIEEGEKGTGTGGWAE